MEPLWKYSPHFCLKTIRQNRFHHPHQRFESLTPLFINIYNSTVFLLKHIDVLVLFLPASVLQKASLEKEEDAPVEIEWEPTQWQTTHSPKNTSYQVAQEVPGLKKISPTLRLKSIFKPAIGYLCDLCSQSFPSSFQLLKHKQFHQENSENVPTKKTELVEPEHIQEISFSCNMCDQSFATNHILKRHKLLHVRDGRRCPWCGVLFCRRHNHVAFLPQSPSGRERIGDKSEPEETEEREEPAQPKEPKEPEKPVESDRPKQPNDPKDEPKEPGESKAPASHDGALCIMTETPTHVFPVLVALPVFTTSAHSLEVSNLVPPLSQSKGSKEMSSLKELSMLPVRRVQSPPSKHIKLPTNLEMFSPQRLTSVFFEVQRNYKYIIKKAKAQNLQEKKMNKKEQCEKNVIPQWPQGAVPQLAHSNVPIKKERIAYDMEILL